jgi:oligopeptidase B
MQNSTPPDVTKKHHKMTEHGHTRVDDYYWMRLTDEQKSAEKKDSHTQEVVDYIEAENDYTESRLKHTKKISRKAF